MTGEIVLLWLTALPLMGSPGPATMSLAATGAAFGPRRGVRYLSGIIAGTFGVLILIATGVTGLILAMPELVWIITLAAAIYILYLAYRIATAPALGTTPSGAPAPSFHGGFFLAIANPKAYAAIGAVYSANVLIAGNAGADASAKVAALLVVIVVVNSAWLLFGATLSYWLHDPRASRAINLMFAVLLVGSVVLAVSQNEF